MKVRFADLDIGDVFSYNYNTYVKFPYYFMPSNHKEFNCFVIRKKAKENGELTIFYNEYIKCFIDESVYVVKET